MNWKPAPNEGLLEHDSEIHTRDSKDECVKIVESYNRETINLAGIVGRSYVLTHKSGKSNSPLTEHQRLRTKIQM